MQEVGCLATDRTVVSYMRATGRGVVRVEGQTRGQRERGDVFWVPVVEVVGSTDDETGAGVSDNGERFPLLQNTTTSNPSVVPTP